MLPRLAAILRALLTRRRANAEADDELAFHVEQETRANIARGMTPSEARRRALADLGGVTQTRERVRDARATWLDALWQDTRYALRAAYRERGFTATAALTIALGVAASTTTFGVTYGVLLRPLPYADPDRLFLISEGQQSGAPAWASGTITRDTFEAWRDRGETIEGITAHAQMFRTIGVGGEPVRVRAAAVSANMFDLLGVRPFRGRFFRADEDTIGAEPAVVVSHALWRARFSSDESLVGHHVAIDDEPYLVIGIAPADFVFPHREVSLWITYARSRARARPPDRWRADAIVRLRSAVSFERAETEATAISERVHRMDATDATTEARRVHLTPLLENQTGKVERALQVLMAASVAVLLIALANVTGLFALRSLRRRRELAARAALGASSGRLLQGLIAHALVIGIIGGGLGVATTAGLQALVVSLAPPDFPRLHEIAFTPAVAMFAVVAMGITILTSALVPAWRVTRRQLFGTLRSPSDGTPARFGMLRLKTPNALLLVGELALSCALVVTAGLLGRSFTALVAVDPGYVPANVVTAQVSFPRAARSAERSEITRRLLENFTARHTVQAGITNALPLEAVQVTFSFDYARDGQKTERIQPEFRVVSPGYLEAAGMTLLAGRSFTWQDRADTPSVFVVNQAFVRRYLSGDAAVGTQLPVGNGAPSTIIGVVADVRDNGLAHPPRPTMYATFLQRTDPFVLDRVDLVIRPQGSATAFIRSLRRTIRDTDDRLAVYKVSTMADDLRESVASPRLYAWTSTTFALVSSLIATIGLYGTLLYAATQRRREIAIRVALGAAPTRVTRLIARDAFAIAAAAIAIGCGAGYAAARILRGLLFGITPVDPVAFVVAPAIIVLVTACASVVPVRRSLRVQPSAVLRDE